MISCKFPLQVLVAILHSALPLVVLQALIALTCMSAEGQPHMQLLKKRKEQKRTEKKRKEKKRPEKTRKDQKRTERKEKKRICCSPAVLSGSGDGGAHQ